MSDFNRNAMGPQLVIFFAGLLTGDARIAGSAASSTIGVIVQRHTGLKRNLRKDMISVPFRFNMIAGLRAQCNPAWQRAYLCQA